MVGCIRIQVVTGICIYVAILYLIN